MKRGSRTRLLDFGYTIIEVMIVLAVSSLLLVAAIAAISGQQQKTEFSQAIRDIESQVRDVSNDVAHGFYPNTNNFSCTAHGGGPILKSLLASQGSNKDCIFIGRAIQFGLANSGGHNFNIYSLVGQRQINNGGGARDVSTLNEAHPTVIARSLSSDADFPDASEQQTLGYGLKIQSMKYVVDSTSIDIGSIAFVSDLAKLQNNNLQSGTPGVNLMPIVGTSLNQNPLAAVQAINGLNNASPVNPNGGVVICFASSGNDQNGVLTIGSNGRELSTNLAINQGACP